MVETPHEQNIQAMLLYPSQGNSVAFPFNIFDERTPAGMQKSLYCSLVISTLGNILFNIEEHMRLDESPCSP